MNIEIDGNTYELIENYREAFDNEEFKEKYTEFFKSYDYIVGDISYGKLRLKGFNDKRNKMFNKINDYSSLKKYIEENCAFDCKYYVLRKKSV